jgi:[NiFe] hydrogenase diaphorase moiety large subunit
MLETLEAILARRREEGLLGRHILGKSDFSFDIEIHMGAGAYICGAETALIESLEGNRGVPRKRPPPFPVTRGYMGKPTVVNNVETFALAAKIMTLGSDRFALLGTSQSKGTKLISVSGDCDRPGIYEFPFGVTVREVIEAAGGRDTIAIQNSGPAGVLVTEDEFDRLLCFEDINTTGSFMIFNRSRDMLDVIRNFAHFFVHESCGFCTSCRVGTSLIARLVDKVYAGNATSADLKELVHLGHVIKTTTHCGLGMTAPNAVLDSLKKLPQIYENRLKSKTLTPSFDLDASLETARQITHRTDQEAHL